MNDTPSTPIATSGSAPATPWWRVGMVWLVLGGPAAVVVAATVTAVIAIRGADPIVTDEQVAQRAGANAQAYLPAVQARNHAATSGR